MLAVLRQSIHLVLVRLFHHYGYDPCLPVLLAAWVTVFMDADDVRGRTRWHAARACTLVPVLFLGSDVSILVLTH